MKYVRIEYGLTDWAAAYGLYSLSAIIFEIFQDGSGGRPALSRNDPGRIEEEDYGPSSLKLLSFRSSSGKKRNSACAVPSKLDWLELGE
jgi:hypothetical protein